MTIFCFVGGFGWLRHLGVAEDNRDVAFLVFLYTEKGIFFHILSYIFATECQIPVGGPTSFRGAKITIFVNANLN